MPLRSAISRAFARSGSGSRRAICTLAALFHRATRREPFGDGGGGLVAVVVAVFCFRNARPAGLAHQSASCDSLTNSGMTIVFLGLLGLLASEAAREVVLFLAGIEVVGCDSAELLRRMMLPEAVVAFIGRVQEGREKRPIRPAVNSRWRVPNGI